MRDGAWFFVFRDIAHLVWFCLPVLGTLWACELNKSDEPEAKFGAFLFFGWAIIANITLAIGYSNGWNVK